MSCDLQLWGVSPLANEFCLLQGVDGHAGLVYYFAASALRFRIFKTSQTVQQLQFINQLKLSLHNFDVSITASKQCFHWLANHYQCTILLVNAVNITSLIAL